MHSAIAAFVLALVVTSLVTPLVRRVATGAGVVDQPGGRRVHNAITPRLGGVAVIAGFFVPLAAFAVVKTTVMRSFMERPELIIGLVLGAAVVGLIGAVDDVRSLGPWLKLGAQAVAAVVAYAFGYRIDGVNLPWFGEVQLGILALPTTVLWFLAITNAVNLIDGLDGLATGIALFTTLSNFAIAYVRGSDVVMLLSAALGGSLLGFLRYNFNPATIFLGDSGSMFLGFALAATSIGGQLTKSSTAVTLLAPVLALGIPIVDTLLAMVRRTLARQSIFAADRGHIHHKMLDLGFTHRRVVLTLYCVSVVLAVAAVSVAIGHATEIGAALAVVGIVLFAVVRAVTKRRSSIRAAEVQLLGRIGEVTQAAVAELAMVNDEAQLRRSLANWSDGTSGLRAELYAGDSMQSSKEVEATQVFDVSSGSRKRYLRISWNDGRSPDEREWVRAEVQTLAVACSDAIGRLSTRSATGSGLIRQASVRAIGAKD